MLSMSPAKKYGIEFVYDEIPLQVPGLTAGQAVCLQAGVCIKPRRGKEETLILAWKTVRELAKWLLDQSDDLSGHVRYQIVIGWSKTIRRQQGQIFKIFGDADRLRLILNCENYRQFSEIAPDNWVPLPGWEKDVFTKE